MALALALPAFGDGVVDPRDMPGPLKEVGFDQHLGDGLPLDAAFTDEQGRAVTLGDYFGERPVVLAFVYYDCPMLCPMMLDGVAKTLGVLTFDAGREFDVVAISIDPAETPQMAAGRKNATVKRYGREQTAGGWHFLTGTPESIRRVTEAAGFRYTYVEENQATPEGGQRNVPPEGGQRNVPPEGGQRNVPPEGGKRNEWAHASGMIVATPDGTLSQYFYGLDFSPKNVRLALVEASAGTVGTVVDQILLYCFRYDPQLGKYTAVVTRILRLAGVAFLAVLGTFLWIMWRRDRIAADRVATDRIADRPRTSAAGVAPR